MILNVAETSSDVIYKVLIGSVLPRPIAWVSTRSKSGADNLAPFSFFNAVSSEPAILAFSVGLKSDPHDPEVGIPKDTLRNIEETKEFVVNVVSRSLAEKMNQTSGEYPSNLSEFDAAGLTRAASSLVTPPRVGESLINIECKLYDVIKFGTKPGAGNLILGEILCIHLDDSVYKNGHVDIEALQPIGRLAGISYSTTDVRFEIARPRLT